MCYHARDLPGVFLCEAFHARGAAYDNVGHCPMSDLNK